MKVRKKRYIQRQLERFEGVFRVDTKFFKRKNDGQLKKDNIVVVYAGAAVFPTGMAFILSGKTITRNNCLYQWR